jgi:hypothetical protein
MSEHDLVKRQVRLLLYMIALLHLACMAMLHRSAPVTTQAGSHYAMRSVTGTGAPLPPRPRI